MEMAAQQVEQKAVVMAVRTAAAVGAARVGAERVVAARAAAAVMAAVGVEVAKAMVATLEVLKEEETVEMVAAESCMIHGL